MSPKMNTSKIVLTAALESFAVDQITAFETDWKKAKAGVGSMSNHLLMLAKRAEKDGGPEKRDELYKALCRHAETVYKQAHLGPKNEELPIKRLLPFWPVAKSQVQAGLNAGLKMADYKTVFEITEALPKRERAPKTPDGTTANGGEDSAVSLPKGAHGEALAAALQRFHRTIKAVVVQRKELIADTAVKIMALCDSIDADAKLVHEADTKGQAPNVNRNPIGMPEEQVA